jgi:hypothetical protein
MTNQRGRRLELLDVRPASEHLDNRWNWRSLIRNSGARVVPAAVPFMLKISKATTPDIEIRASYE